MDVTAFSVAQRFLGIAEGAGAINEPLVLAMLRLDAAWVEDDETPWCSAFVNFVCWILGLPRSRSLAARSWLLVGQPVDISDATSGFDIVVLSRGTSHGPDVLAAPGHVGFYAGVDQSDRVMLLGGNQGNAVTLAPFPKSRVLGVRRLR